MNVIEWDCACGSDFCLLDGVRLDLADQKGRSNLFIFPLLY